jgi:hypothetical protein
VVPDTGVNGGRQRFTQRQRAVGHGHHRFWRAPPFHRPLPAISIKHQVVISGQVLYPTPHRLPGKWIQGGRIEQVQRQALLVHCRVEQPSEHVGSIRSNGDPLDRCMEYPLQSGDRALHPYPPVYRR